METNNSPQTQVARRKTRNDWIESVISRFFVWAATRAWQATSESAQALFARIGTHLVVVVLAALAVTLSGMKLPEHMRSASVTPTPVVNQDVHSEQLPHAMRGGARMTGDETLVVRQALPLTPLIYRPRKSVISYTVQAGDTMFGIALQFNLQPESILWANPDLKDNPDLLSVGMDIAIPPVDGVLHTVQVSDTLESIAQKYKVAPEAILNAMWNNLTPGQDLPVGKSLVVPGGKRELVVWQLPKTTQASSAIGARGWTDAGQCLGVTPQPLGTGRFVWPVNSHQASAGGNPYAWWHRGLDLAGNLGDPVYAADNGTVIWAGPNSWGYGNMVMLDHGNGWRTLYAHLSQVYVRCGQQVLQGVMIGTVGSTGRSSGPHLHFETRLNGDLPNPYLYLPQP